MEVLLTKTLHGHLIPATEEEGEKMRRFKVGGVIRAEVSAIRNYRFHKKFFALLKIGFDAWEPPEGVYKGETTQKNFDRFREECTILAGYYDVTASLNGDVKLRAKSISFASMDEDQFEKLYSNVIDVILQRVLVNTRREELDQAVDRVLGFA